ncbi:hypothetical protein [Pseudomonas sp. ES3-33]|uniref:hypothetical protein n=1 Tax=Pseudomonas sp. ES3-33 TaxID=1628833 RepID=UPI0005D45623|nr:hypothetical protein [Pseudomonas sp. ES3-33]
MRIKEAGKRLQLVRTTYTPESRRGVDKMIASVSSEAINVPFDVLPLLTPEEIKQVNDALLKRYVAKQKESYRMALKEGFVAAGTLAVDALTYSDIVDALTPEEVTNLWSVLGRVQRAMEKAKLPRPKDR